MRLVYTICVLLAITICCIASDNANPTTQGDAKPKQDVVASSVPPVTSGTDATAVPKINNSTTNATKPSSTTDLSTTNSTTVVPNNPSVPDSKNETSTTVTTDTPTSKNTTVTVPTTPLKPTTVTNSTTEKHPTSTVAPPTTANSTPSASAAPITTPNPVSTEPAPYVERHFDGLSFFGGIILATCLMAIAVFSLKFYKTYSGNYRTL